MTGAVSRVISYRIGAKPGAGERAVPVEVPVAIVYDGTTHAVMLASPTDLEDFARGFSLTERIIDSPDAIRAIDIVEQPSGVEARVWLQPQASLAVATRRRALAGPTGCGLCGVDSLEAAVPALVPTANTIEIADAAIFAAVNALAPAQVLNRATQAVHAAAWADRNGRLVAIAEDVGRHNALDKLIGRLIREGVDPTSGFIVLTCRVSVEMIQKSVVFGAGLVVAVSAPTSLAIRTADETNLTLVAVARADAFEVFTHPARVLIAQATQETRPCALTSS
jgi:FdhD protein